MLKYFLTTAPSRGMMPPLQVEAARFSPGGKGQPGFTARNGSFYARVSGELSPLFVLM